MPLDRGYEELDRLFGKLGDVQEVLQDPQVTSARLVMNPERMVIQEAKRAYTYLQLYGYGVDAAIVNRVVPADEAGGVMEKYVQGPRPATSTTSASRSRRCRCSRSRNLGQEVFGLELLEQIGEGLYADRDPAAVYHSRTRRIPSTIKATTTRSGSACPAPRPATSRPSSSGTTW